MNNPKGFQPATTTQQGSRATPWPSVKVLGVEQPAELTPITSGVAQIPHTGYRRYPAPFAVPVSKTAYSEVNELRL